MPKDLVIREAVRGDTEAVLDFCQHTFDWGDYVPAVWERWLADPNGRLLVGTIAKRPVAVAYVVLVTPHEAWMQGMRVNPAFRQQGISTALTRALAEVARHLGASVARLSTLASNEAIHRIMRKRDFRRVGGFQNRYVEVPATEPKGNEASSYFVLGPDDFDDVVVYLDTSPIFETAGRLYCRRWACRILSVDDIRVRLEAGDVVTAHFAGTISSLAVLQEEPDPEAGLVVEYADGTVQTGEWLATALVEHARKLGLARVTVRLPLADSLEQAFAAAGFAPGDAAPFWVFEKWL